MNTMKFFGFGAQNLFCAIAAIIALALTACPPEPGDDTLSGNVTISPNGTVNVNTELTAAYSGTETVTFQWYMNNVAVPGEITAKYTPTAAGTCTVTVNAPGYTSKTSAAVTVTNLHTHTWGAWQSNATEHWKECTANDGAKTDEAAHTAGNWIIDTPATATTAGSRHKECTVCGYVTETETIPQGDGTPAHTHTWGNWIQTTAPTITAEGVETRTCAACGAAETKTIAKLVSMIETIRVNGGSFQMGKNGDGTANSVTPVHEVTLAAFSIGKYEVTQKQWYTVMGTTIQQQNEISDYQGLDGVGDNYPMYHVSWYEALVFCNKLSVSEGLTPAYRIDGKTNTAEWGTVPTSSDATWNAVEVVSGSNGYRLPTEAQWEYAAKGGPSASDPYKIYSGSDTVGDVAWYSGNNGSSGDPDYGAKQVGTKAANELGIYDMSGNVFEWCWDWYAAYEDEAQTDPVGASSGSIRVWRGGSWGALAVGARSAYRAYVNPDIRYYGLGFRVLRP